MRNSSSSILAYFIIYYAVRRTSSVVDVSEKINMRINNNKQHNGVTIWAKENVRPIMWTKANTRQASIERLLLIQNTTKDQKQVLYPLISTQAKFKLKLNKKFRKLMDFYENRNQTNIISILSIQNMKNQLDSGQKHYVNQFPIRLKAKYTTTRNKEQTLKNIRESFEIIPIPKLHSSSTFVSNNTRKRRSTLVHQLIRTPFLNFTEETFQKENTLIDINLNSSSFATSVPEKKLDSMELTNDSVMSYEELEELTLADLNGTKMTFNGNDTSIESLPSPEELVSQHQYRISHRPYATYFKGESKRKRIPNRTHQLPKIQRKCKRFTASMCIKADDYPLDLIMGSIRRHKNAMSALLAEYHDRSAEIEDHEIYDENYLNNKRREDDNMITPGGMCASIVRYARPQKARSASGEWKYIVNAGRHTQTLRLEKCSTPQESCSYLSHNYRSRCTQVYNYHRLLSWDKTRGLHVDIFKIPTCCSCQVDGYRETFPPFESLKYKDYKEYTPLPNNNPYTNLNDEIEYEDEDEDQNPVIYRIDSTFKKPHHHTYHQHELFLGGINRKFNLPYNQAIETYLSPPSNKYELSSKTVIPTHLTSSNGMDRKPYKNYDSHESRTDLAISETEHANKEVRNVVVRNNSHIHQKRTRLYTNSLNLPTPYDTSIVQTKSIPNYSPTTEITTHLSTSNILNPREIGSNKRINYNYHPIIDFFERNQKSPKGQSFGHNAGTDSIPISSEVITTRDWGHGVPEHENTWHPLVVSG